MALCADESLDKNKYFSKKKKRQKSFFKNSAWAVKKWLFLARLGKNRKNDAQGAS